MQTELNFTPPKKPYHNTTHLKGDDLAREYSNARAQDERVFRIFVLHGELTASEAHRIYCQAHPAVPITSIRRAISDLAKSKEKGGPELLEKTGNFNTGPYNKNEHCWQIKAPRC
jgi:hypothetical protein